MKVNLSMYGETSITVIVIREILRINLILHLLYYMEEIVHQMKIEKIWLVGWEIQL